MTNLQRCLEPSTDWKQKQYNNTFPNGCISFKVSPLPHFEVRSALTRGTLLHLFIRPYKSVCIIEDTAHEKLCGGHGDLCGKLYVMLHSYLTQQKTALQFWLMRRKGLGFVCPTNWPVSNQPYTYLYMEGSSKLKNAVLIPWVTNKRCVHSFTRVQRSVSCSVKRGLLMKTCWSSLQAIRR